MCSIELMHKLKLVRPPPAPLTDFYIICGDICFSFGGWWWGWGVWGVRGGQMKYMQMKPPAS